ncbi:glutaredoxin, partial [Baffinella frigidus]
VFSKSYCPHCKNTKQLLTGLGISFNADELDQMHDGPQIQQELMKLTGQRTVPNVFINGKHLGGNDDLMAARNSGKLKTLLQGAGVTFGEEL